MQAKTRIMIVEDERIVARDIKDMLENMGYSVPTIISTGEEAIRQADVLRPDLILMDIVLAGLMNGIETADKIYKTLRIPVIYLTAYSHDDILQTAKQTDSYGYLLKPFNENELHATIEIGLYKHRVQQSLEESEQRFKSLYEHHPDAVMFCELEGKIIDGNCGCTKVTGYNLQDMRQMFLPEMVVKEDREYFLDRFQKVYEGLPLSFETSFMHKEGRFIQVNVTTVPVVMNGTIKGIYVIAKDVTREKEAKELSIALADSSHIGIYVTHNGRFELLNPKAADYLGRDPQKLMGTEAICCVHPDDREQVKANIRAHLIKEKSSSPYEYRIVDGNGRIRWILETVTSIFYKGKRSILGSSMDVTDIKEATEQVRKLEKIAASILEAIPHAVLGLENRRITFVNNSVEKVFGWKTEEVIDKKTDILYRSENESREIGRKIYNLLEEQQSCSVESDIPCLHRNGREIFCRISASRIGEIFENQKVVAVLEDITQRKQSENELRQSYDKLKKVTEGSIQMIATIVEMRDPYTAGHQQRVARLACAIAEAIDVSHDRLEGIEMAAVIHDIGKIYIPAEILSKPSQLSAVEYDMMKTHPLMGYQILQSIEFPWPVADIVYQHHERFNGSGYPKGLAGENILLEARILAIADVVEAMASHRPYRPALGIGIALDEIQKNSGVLYDPELVEACLDLFSKGFSFE